MEDCFEHADLNKNQHIEYTEWLIATTSRETPLTSEQLKAAFQYFADEDEGLSDDFISEAFK